MKQSSLMRCSRGFSLIELLVVLSIVSLLVGILLPTLARVRVAAMKTRCQSNLRQVGIVIEAYKVDFKEVFPVARQIPEPFVSADPDPPLTAALSHYLPPNDAESRRVYECPGDHGYVFDRAGISYQYSALLSGLRAEAFFPVLHFGVPPSQIWVARDFDGGDFDLITSDTVTVPFFHDLRNLLFADGHAGNFE